MSKDIQQNVQDDMSETEELIPEGYDDIISAYGVFTGDIELAGYNPYSYTHGLDNIFAQANYDTKDGIILSITKLIIDKYKSINGAFSIMEILKKGTKISNQWVTEANNLIASCNTIRMDGNKVDYHKVIPPRAVALLLMATGDFLVITDVYHRRNGIIMRQRCGDDIGTWKMQDGKDMLNMLITCLNGSANMSYRNEVRNILETELKTAEETMDNKIILLEDGIYDFNTEEFTPYEHPNFDENYSYIISRTKLYNVLWTPKSSDELEQECTFYNPEDGTTWSPIQGLIDLVGDGIALQALRETMHFAIRRMSGGFAWWWLNTSGNASGGGGKSTCIQIIKNLVGGDRNTFTMSYDHLGDRFALNGLETKYAIVSDETEGANRKPESVDVYKTLITNGTVAIDVKYKEVYYIKWSGCMIQAINGIPLFSDNSDSTYRRFLALPWEKQMTKNGIKRDYIRDDYINRPKVIQCYMKWALELGCLTTYSKEVIDYCLPYVEMMKVNTKSVYEFMPEMMRREKDEGYFAGMNELGRSFLYALYCKWDEEENCVLRHISQKKFWISVCEWVQSHPDCGWVTTEKTTHIYPNTPYQQELVDYDIGTKWCAYIVSTYNVRRPSGYFCFSNKSIRCGLLRANKLPKNSSQTVVQGNSDNSQTESSM